MTKNEAVSETVKLAVRLQTRLQSGATGDAGDGLAASLSLAEEADDNELATALVRQVARNAHERLGFAKHQEAAGPGEREDSRVIDNRASYLMRLSIGTDQPGTDIERMDDVRTLIAVLHAGTLRQRRAATLRLGELMRDPRGLPVEQGRTVVETLVHLRKFEIAYELSQVCAQLPGAEGRRARAGRREWDQLVEDVAESIRDYWESDASQEPLTSLHADQQVQLLVRTRDLPDDLVTHICAVIEGTAGLVALTERIALVAALLNAGDSRLVPSLRAAIDAGDGELVRPAARALGRIDDPRVHPILKGAFERSVRAEQRLALAGALGMMGDSRGHGYVREVLSGEDATHVPYALQALDSLGTTEDVAPVAALLDREEPVILMAAVRTLGRIGDGRALLPLSRLRKRSPGSALRAEIEEARAAIHSRMELLGEEPPSGELSMEMFDTSKMAAMVKRRDPAVIRFRATWSLVVAYLYRALGAHRKAIARFEIAAALRPQWVAPVLAVALTQSRRGNYAQALATFRRALEINRDEVEEHYTAVRHLAQSFLRRAEAVELDGRLDIACGLLEEALSLDLRKAPSGLRFALNQRHEVLRARTG